MPRWPATFVRATWLLACLVLLSLGFAPSVQAGFQSTFSLDLSEEYNDNIFFSEEQLSDFITAITPAFGLTYVPPDHTKETFSAGIRLPLQIYARNSEQNNFAENASIFGRYGHEFSPRLSFQIRDTFRRTGQTRTSTTNFDFAGQASLVNSGQLASNDFSVSGGFLYSANITFDGRFNLDTLHFLDEGGSDVTSRIGFRGVYKVGPNHKFHAGYTLKYFRPRNGEDEVIHDFDIGSDYLSNYKIQLTPTLTFTASGGISTGSQQVRPRLSAILTKLWPTASVTTGIRSRVTGSLGVSGLSQTTDVFTGAKISLSERLTGTAGGNFSHFDTFDSDSDSFNVFRAQIGMQYLITHWLSSKLAYTFRWRDGEGSGGGVIDSNSVTLSFTSYFDIWPNFGLSKTFAVAPRLPSPVQ